MYEQVFNFNSRPFTTTPYVRHYFAASSIHQAIGQASICVERGSGPVIAIGDIGVGKSLFLEMLQSHFQHQLVVVTVACSRDSSRREFLQNILFQLGRPTDAAAEAELRFAIIEAANPSEACPNGILLLVDDAEVLSPEIFDELRLLMNFVVDGAPRIRLVLAGQKSLEDRLARPEIASFSQRIASRVFLQSLTREETNQYVIEHIDRVGGAGATMFPPETNAKLFEVTEGCPRQINQVCDFVLILAGTRGLTSISPQLIAEAWSDVQSLPGAGGFQPETNVAEAPSDWTVIEFGQLDDESAASPSPLADAIGLPPASETAMESASDAPDAAVETVEPQPSFETEDQSPASTQSTGDPDLGIDLAALQAMRDAHAGGQPEPADSSESQQATFTPATSPVPASEAAADESMADVFKPAAGIENVVKESSQVPETAPGPAAGIQSELAAVFGSMNFEGQQSPEDSGNSLQQTTEETVGADQEPLSDSVAFDSAPTDSVPTDSVASNSLADQLAELTSNPDTPLASETELATEPPTISDTPPASEVVSDAHAGDPFAQSAPNFEAAEQNAFTPASDALGIDRENSTPSDYDAVEPNVVESHEETLQANESLMANDGGDSARDLPAEEQVEESDPLAEFQASLAQLRAGNQEAWDAASTSETDELSNQNFVSAADSQAVEATVDSNEVDAERFAADATEECGVETEIEAPVEIETQSEINDQAGTHVEPTNAQQPLDVETVQPAPEPVNIETPESFGGENDHHSEPALDDPFAESFDQVEAVVDRFAPEIAIQNQNALEITSADLKHVKPLVDSPELQDAAETASETSAEANVAIEELTTSESFYVGEEIDGEQTEDASAGHATCEPVETVEQGQVESVSQSSFAVPSGVNWIKDESSIQADRAEESIESVSASEPAQPPTVEVEEPSREETVDEELTAKLNASKQLRGFTISPPSQFQVQPEESGFVPAMPASSDQPESEAHLQFNQAPLSPASEPQDATEPPAQPVVNQTKAEFEFVQPTYELTDRETAKAIDAAESNLTPNVQDVAQPTSDVSDSAPMQSQPALAAAPAETQYRQPHVNEATSEEISRQADEILKRLERSNLQAETVSQLPTVETDESDSDMSILNEIRKQQQLVAGVKVEDEVAAVGAVEDEDTSDHLPSTVPMVSSGQRADDSEMLFVKQPKESREDETSRMAKPSQPGLGDQVSKGRAQRMNYEQLFDRLRDMKDND